MSHEHYHGHGDIVIDTVIIIIILWLREGVPFLFQQMHHSANVGYPKCVSHTYRSMYMIHKYRVVHTHNLFKFNTDASDGESETAEKLLVF